MRTYRTFDSWANLLDAIRAEYRIAYHAPLDVRPIQVGTTIRRDGRVRVTPIYANADPFTADEGHLSRFRAIRDE